MGLEGVEDEYAESLQCLKNWLGGFTNQASYLQDNAQVLHEFLAPKNIDLEGLCLWEGFLFVVSQ